MASCTYTDREHVTHRATILAEPDQHNPWWVEVAELSTERGPFRTYARVGEGPLSLQLDERPKKNARPKKK